MQQLWGGRFKGSLDPAAFAMNASITVDFRLAKQDVRGSLVWAKALLNAGALSENEHAQIRAGLETIASEIENGQFEIHPSDEDIHSAIERRLHEIISEPAGKLHTGRSRNDQVATDFRLWLLDHLPLLEKNLLHLQQALVNLSENTLGILLPGFTHLQPAQPILLSHWLLSFFWPLERDRQRLGALRKQTSSLPLGSGAIAGTPYPVDRQQMAIELGFDQPGYNSIDSVSDRDFAAEFLFISALIGVHLSHLSESMVIFSNPLFNFIELPDAFSTGSSLMPQKKNPDLFELARGKSGGLTGNLIALLVTLKGLASAYDKDLQEDKSLVFSSFDTLLSILSVFSIALPQLKFLPEKMLAAIDPTLMATDLADYLVKKGVPFRQAHHLSGQIVLTAENSHMKVNDLPLDVLSEICPLIDQDFYAVFDPWTSVNKRSVTGGTALSSVNTQLQQAKAALLTSTLHP